MKLTLTKRDLSKALGLVSPYIKGRNTLPILSCVSIEANIAMIALSGTDLETGVKANVPGIVLDDSGQAVVDLKEMKEALKGTKPSDEVTLDTGSDFSVRLGISGTEYNVSGMDPSEYPVLPVAGVMKSYEMPGDVFRSMLGSVSYAAEKDNFRYFLNGVYFNLSPKTSEFVATDGRRLALSSCAAMTGLVGNLSGIIPLPTVKRSLKTFARSERVEFGVNKMNDTLFLTDGISTVNSRLVEGEYPKYKEILPASRPHKIVVGVDDLLKATQQMLNVPFSATLRDKKQSTVVFDISHDSMTLSAKSKTTDVKAETSIPIENGGEDLRIAFDAFYIEDALKALPGEKVEIGFGKHLDIAVLKPAGDSNHLALVMPKRLE